MKKICDKEKCTGCGACYNLCSHSAIEMKEDACGFFYPTINQDLCVDCGLCTQRCPANNHPNLHYPIKCYATVLPNDEDLKRSASGGASTAFMRYVIIGGGVAYGACGNNIFNVHHVRMDSIEDIERSRGSKYVQSCIGDTYKYVKQDLLNGKQVVFTGTPCQVAGLQSFLHKDYDNLVTVDLVCHGVPSQKMLNENISYYTGEKEGEGIKVAFRRKRKPRRDFAKLNPARIEYGWFLQNQPYSIAKRWYEDSYMFAFISCLSFRESCYSCRYATGCRISDITISDFWGIGSDTPFDKGKGVSACLINTEKGVSFFQEASCATNVMERTVVEAINGNGQLQHPSNRPSTQTMFRSLYPTIGLKKAVNRCLRKEKIKVVIVKPLASAIKTIIKRIL